MSRFDPTAPGRRLARPTAQQRRRAERPVGDERIRSGRGGRPLARVQRPVLMVAPARDLIEAPQPLSWRRGAEVRGASHDSLRRRRMAIVGALMAGAHTGPAAPVGVRQRERRDGAREWVRHPHDADNRLFRCTGGFATDERVTRFAHDAGRLLQRKLGSHPIDSANAPISPSGAIMQHLRGLASKNLAARGRWHAARNRAGCGCVDAPGLPLAAGPRDSTIR